MEMKPTATLDTGMKMTEQLRLAIDALDRIHALLENSRYRRQQVACVIARDTLLKITALAK